jgi:hypothetical protein
MRARRKSSSDTIPASFSAVALDDGHPSQSGFGHAEDDGVERLVRPSHHRVAHHITERDGRIGGLRQGAQTLAGYNATQAPCVIHDREQMLPARIWLAEHDVS